MSIKEIFYKLLLRNRNEALAPSEMHRNISVQFYDLRETEAAKGRGVDPGYYIHIDNKAEMFVDPAQSWFFSPAGYIDRMQLLVVRANHADRDDAQKMIVTALH